MREQLRGIRTGTKEAVNCILEEPANNYTSITWFSSKLFFDVTKIYTDTTRKQTYHVRISNLFRLYINKTFLIELDSYSYVQELYDKVQEWFKDNGGVLE